MIGTVVTKATGYSVAAPTEGSLFARRRGQPDGVGPGVVALHGHAGSSTQYAPSGAKDSVGYFLQLLASEGFRVMAIDDQGGTDWGSQDSTSRISEAVAWLQSTGGAKAGRVGLMGWSMGGLAALNWLDQNASSHACSWLWAPATDLEWAHAQPAWTAEIDAAYSTEGTRAGNSPAATPANYRGVGPVRLCHATDDATVPVQQSRDFVAAVNDPAVTLEEFASGGHASLFANATDYEVARFYRDALGVPAGSA